MKTGYYPPSFGNKPANDSPAGQSPAGSSYLPARPQVPRRRAPRNFSEWANAALIVALGAGGLLALLVAAVLSYYVYYQVTGRIIPGVHVGSLPLGGMTRAEAANALHHAWNVEGRIAVSDGFQMVVLAPAELGLSLNAEKTAWEAFAVGHSQNILAELDQIIYSQINGWGVAPVVDLDAGRSAQGLQSLAGQISRAPREATFSIQGARVVPVPGEIGYTVNVEESLKRLAADPRLPLVEGMFTLALMPVSPQVSDAAAAAAAAQRLIDSPPHVIAYDPIRDERFDWAVAPEAVASWLRVGAGEEGPQVDYDPQAVSAYLANQGDALGDGRWIDAGLHGPALAQALQSAAGYTVLVSHHPTSYTVQSGDTLLKIGWKTGMPYWRIAAANPGMDIDALQAGAAITIPSKDDLLPLAVVPGKRIIININEQRLYVIQDGQTIAKHVISTGIDRSPTQPGVFQVMSHDPNAYASVWDLHMPHFLGIYEAWPGFMNGIHGLPTLSNGQRLWANVLGRPASYGCIILELKAARQLYNWAEEGVVVEIQP